MANLIEKKINIFGTTINPLTMLEAVDAVSTWVKYAESDCKFIVTPNVNCVVQLSKNPAYREAFTNAAMVVADGKPVVWVARLFGEIIPGTVTGSDLVPAIFQRFHDEANTELKVYLLGAMPGVAEVAASNIERTYKHVKVVGFYSPPFGFEKDAAECARICALIAESGELFTDWLRCSQTSHLGEPVCEPITRKSSYLCGCYHRLFSGQQATCA